MSGGGGGGSWDQDWRPPTSGSANDKCNIVERTVLNSPVATVVSELKVGDILFVELETTPRNRVVAKSSAGTVAGAITSTKLVDLIECLQDGHTYEGEVISVHGGRIEIEIRLA